LSSFEAVRARVQKLYDEIEQLDKTKIQAYSGRPHGFD
jgi:hypothetical protein